MGINDQRRSSRPWSTNNGQHKPRSSKHRRQRRTPRRNQHTPKPPQLPHPQSRRISRHLLDNAPFHPPLPHPIQLPRLHIPHPPRSHHGSIGRILLLHTIPTTTLPPTIYFPTHHLRKHLSIQGDLLYWDIDAEIRVEETLCFYGEFDGGELVGVGGWGGDLGDVGEGECVV